MAAALRAAPPQALLVYAACLMMLIPVGHALTVEDWQSARVFLAHGALFAVLATMVALARANRRRRSSQNQQLVQLLLAYVLLPVILAAPVHTMIPTITFGQAYFEMLSALTTTGATLLPDPATVPASVHLWRGLVAWGGGLMILVAAVAILEPLQLGGFEIEAAMQPGRNLRGRRLGGASGEAAQRLLHHARQIAPIYGVLTFGLMIGLMLAGDPALVAAIHAMSVLSTSGITPLEGFGDAPSGHAGEGLVLVFMTLALSRRPGAVLTGRVPLSGSFRDVELRLAAILVAAVAGLLFFRHFAGAVDVADQENVTAAWVALWGSVFNVVSFLTTTGFDSRDWAGAQAWSGLESPGMILIGLCLVGGGIATTAGGVKLLRVFALYKHGVREMQRLIHPSSVGGSGVSARRIRREGAQIAWVFLMLFLLGTSLLLLALTALGQDFEDALAFAIASLTNTGPAATLINEDATYVTLTGAERTVIAIGMIFGRLEALVVVSMFHLSYWKG